MLGWCARARSRHLVGILQYFHWHRPGQTTHKWVYLFVGLFTRTCRIRKQQQKLLATNVIFHLHDSTILVEHRFFLAKTTRLV